MSDFSDSILPRGFTGHACPEQSRGKHFSEIALIHMNGRMYDPQMRRFLSPDNFVSDPYDTRSYDRFGYVWQNPLMTIDPSGEEPLTIATVLAFIGKAVAVHQGIRTAYGYSSGYYTGLGPLVNAGIQVATAFIPGASLGSELINLVPAAKTGAGAFIRVAGASAIQGFVSSSIGSVISGASLTDALRAGAQGAIISAALSTAIYAYSYIGAKIKINKAGNLNGDQRIKKNEFGPNGELPKARRNKRVSIEPGEIKYIPYGEDEYVSFAGNSGSGKSGIFMRYSTIDWSMTFRGNAISIGQDLQMIGNPISYAGYALTLSVVGAPAGVPLSALGNGLSTTGSLLESAGNQNWNNIGKSLGILGIEEGTKFLINKIPYQNNLTRTILREGTSFKANLIEKNFVKN